MLFLVDFDVISVEVVAEKQEILQMLLSQVREKHHPDLKPLFGWLPIARFYQEVQMMITKILLSFLLIISVITDAEAAPSNVLLAPNWTEEKAADFHSARRAPYGLPPLFEKEYRAIDEINAGLYNRLHAEYGYNGAAAQQDYFLQGFIQGQA